MKQLPYHPYRWGLGLLISAFLLGCSDEVQIFHPADSNEGLRLELQASIDQVNETRADEYGFADGDRFGVFVVNYSDNQPGTLTLSDNQANNIAFSFNADANKWQAASDIYWRDAETPADIYGYYPFHNGLGDVDAYRFEVQPDQSISGSDGDMGNYEASDFLWAKKGAAKPGQKVELTFSHIMAGVKVILQKGSGFEGDSWEKLPKLVTVDNTLRTANINLSTGVATPSGNFDRNIVMNPESDAYRAVVVPQSVAAGKSVVGITIDGVSYSFTRDGKGMDYASGKLHTFTIKIDRKSDEGNYALTLVNEDITPWETDQSSHDFEANSYLVVHVAEPGTLKASLEALQCNLSTLKNLKIKGNLTKSDFELMRKDMPKLESLNLKETKMLNMEISAWDKPSEYHDDMIPQDAFYGNRTIRRIVLPENINRIGTNAFREMSLNTTLTIPEKVTRIDDFAFSFLDDYATLELPSSLEYIGDRAFLTAAVFELKLSNSLKYIGNGAFNASNASGKFFLPEHLEHIGDEAFSGLGSGKGIIEGSIDFPAHYKEIPAGCFGIGFKNGVNVTIADGITKIGGNSFAGQIFNNRLIIPKSVKIIGYSAFKYATFRNGVTIPENLSFVENHAFGFSSLEEDIVFPTGMSFANPAFQGSRIKGLTLKENILQINEGAFAGCSNLKKITIGKNVEYIGTNAFSDMNSLETVICLATTPPTIEGTAFSGFDVERTVLEVPEQSVDAYRNASGWKVFRIITAHHELTSDLSDIQCLEKGVTRIAKIRAEGQWEIKSLPDWVEISDLSGEYYDEISITVKPMTDGNTEREGKIVYSLKNSDYTTYTTVRQYKIDGEEEDKEIILKNASGDGNPIPVFIVGEGFTADDIINTGYIKTMEKTMDYLLAIEPFITYKDHFKVSTAVACSSEKGTGDGYIDKYNKFGTVNTIPDTKKLREYVGKVSPGIDLSKSLIIVVTNHNGFDGWSEICDDGCSIANVYMTDDVYPYDQRGLVQHYAGGAAFAGLGTEAIYHFEHIKGCKCSCCNDLPKFNEMKNRGFFENLTMSSKMADAPWKDFIFNPTYSSMVDMWEGGFRHYRGVFRSEANSVMNTYISYYNTISRYAIYKQIMRRAGLQATLEDFITNDIIDKPQE